MQPDSYYLFVGSKEKPPSENRQYFGGTASKEEASYFTAALQQRFGGDGQHFFGSVARTALPPDEAELLIPRVLERLADAESAVEEYNPQDVAVYEEWQLAEVQSRLPSESEQPLLDYRRELAEYKRLWHARCQRAGENRPGRCGSKPASYCASYIRHPSRSRQVVGQAFVRWR